VSTTYSIRKPKKPKTPRRAPTFILAPARSYSTVTVAMLAGHPQIYGFPEMLLFTESTVGELLEMKARRPMLPRVWVSAQLSGIIRAVAELHDGCQSGTAIESARKWMADRSEWTPIDLMNHLLELVHPCIGVEKSPETTRSDQNLEACFAAYPDARYLHLTRHPVDTQRSMRSHWGRQHNPRLTEKHVAAMAASTWYMSHNRVITALSQLPERQWIRVRAEDLLRQPHIWIPRILTWMELPCDEKIVSGMLHTELWPFANIGPSGGLYGGDPKFMRSPALRRISEPGPVTFDPSLGMPGEMCRRMELLASYLGY
jgi:hypothetical protein